MRFGGRCTCSGARFADFCSYVTQLGTDRFKLHVGPRCGGRGVLGVTLGGRAFSDDLYIYEMCAHNLVDALVNRLFKPAKSAEKMVRKDAPQWMIMAGVARRMGRKLRFMDPMKESEVLRSCTGRQKPIYRKAFEQMPAKVTKKWKVNTPFVKVEKYTYNDKKRRIPRAIMPNHIWTRAYMARFFKPIEKEMKSWILPGQQYPFIAKGASSGKLATLFLEKWMSVRQPVALSLDVTKFDSSIGLGLKKIENLTFRQFSDDPKFREILKFQEQKTRVKLRYDERGKKRSETIEHDSIVRGSGHNQTGCGNCLVMAYSCFAVFYELRVEFFVNGDDTIVIVAAEDLKEAVDRMHRFEYLGLTVRVEQVETNLEKIEWCQCYLTETELGWRWIRKADRVLSTILANVEYRDARYLGLLSSIALCEASVNPGQPIISPLCAYVAKLGVKKVRSAIGLESERRWKLEGSPSEANVLYEVNPRMRCLFEERYGVSPVEQLRIEEQLCSSQFLATVQEYDWMANDTHPVGVGETRW